MFGLQIPECLGPGVRHPFGEHPGDVARHLSAFFYMVNTIADPPYSDQDGMIAFLREQGFPVSPYFKNCAGREEVFAALDEIEEFRPSLDFLIDGAGIKLRDPRTRAVLGYTDKFPRWAVAYKFAAEEMTSVLRSVTWGAKVNMYVGCDQVSDQDPGSGVLEWYEYTEPMNWDE